MAEYVEVKTQAQLDKALADGKFPICVGNGYFTAYGSAQVTASGSAQVTASGSAQVRAYDSAQVRAYDSAQVRAYDSAQVTASQYVAVTVDSRYGKPKVTGGVLIEIPKLTTAQEWCDYYGLEVKRGAVVLYKAVNDDFRSGYDFEYPIGKKVEAPDWDGGEKECGGGLHFSPRAFMAGAFAETASPRFVACRVRLADVVVHADASMPQKVKAKGCTVLYECDQDGNEIAAEAVAA